MTHTPLRRLLLAAVAAAAVTVTAAPPALAAPDTTYSRSSGHQIFVNWLEVGELPPAAAAPGNAHFGDLMVEDLGGGRASAFGTVSDVQCEPGVTPYLPGGHGPVPGEPVPGEPLPGEPQPDEPCVLLGVRFMEGGDLAFTIDRRLSRATLTGTLAVGSGHGGPTTGAPAVNITWEGVGPLNRSRHYGTFDDGSTTYTSLFRSSNREGRVTAGSRIGPMVFDDEPGEQSFSHLVRYRAVERTRS